ncbi:MAG: S8 family serine peptidase [Candidatus Polarisedimenticolia bacterium]
MKHRVGSILAAGAMVLAGIALWSGAGASGSSARMLVPRTPAIQSLIDSGAIRLLDAYGDERLLVSGPREAIDAALAESPEASPAREVRTSIHLRGRTIDTTRPRLASPLARAGGHLEVIQFDGPVRARWLADMRAGGTARPIAYLPHDACIAWVEEGDRMAASLPLRWRDELAPSDRLSQELAGREGEVGVTVQLVRAGAHDQALAHVLAASRAILSAARPFGQLTQVRVRLDASVLPEISQLPEVVWVEPFEPPTTHDERSALITAGQVSSGRPLPPGYAAWLTSNGLADLSAHIVDITDTGIHTGKPEESHPGLESPLSYMVNATGEANPQDCAGHGTNLAGIIAGAASPWFQTRDTEGYLLGQGIAPTARLGATRIFDCAGQFVPSLTFGELVAGARARGARVGNNSWGGLGSQYNSISAEYDALVRDANLDPADGEQSFLPIFSAGNFGPLRGTVGWPSTGKNVLSVGATENHRPLVTDGCGASTLEADSADHVLTYSSRGPAGDGRVKPDLVAPGSHVYSLASSALDYNGIGNCDLYHPPGQRRITWSTGTSQAAAHVSGAAVIASEVYRRENGMDPSPAMIKAMLINHAHDMKSLASRPTNTLARPNGDQGWGRVDLGNLVEERARSYLDQTTLLSETGQSRRIEPVIVDDPSRQVVITLVWTDAPGTPGGWSWVNDLDLVVRGGGTTWLGNHLVEGVSAPGGRADERNNVEMVILPPGSSVLSIEVTAAHLGGDGVPSVPGETDQDFALYVSNARWVAEPRVWFGARSASCDTSLPLRVVDAGMRGLGHLALTVTAGGDEETASLREDPPGTGFFTGTIDAEPGVAVPGDGALQISAATTVAASYLGLDGTGAVSARTASIPARCGPPALSAIRITRVGDTEATLTWTTDRPATSAVTLTAPGVVKQSRSDTRLTIDHTVRVTPLVPCTPYTAVISSQDEAGRVATTGALPVTTGAGGARRRTLFRDDMEANVSRWTHRSPPPHPGTTDDWQLGMPLAPLPRRPVGPRAWGTRLEGTHSAGLDAVLEIPPIDLTEAVGAQLSFWHLYALSGGRAPDSDNDGAWVEISSDGGASWDALDPLGGYPDTIDGDNPYIAGGSGVWAGTVTTWTRAQFDLSSHQGAVVRLRFHVWHDPAENTPLQAGWYVDDVEVTAQGSCHAGQLLLDGPDYGCSSDVSVTLWDPDLNLSAVTTETVSVTAMRQPVPFPMVLRETSASSGEFRGTIRLGGSDWPVSPGDPLTFRYDDQRPGEAPAAVTAGAVVSDCVAPPAPDLVSIQPGQPGRLDVSWHEVPAEAAPDLQGYRVHYDTDQSGPLYTGVGAQQGASPVRAEVGVATQGLTGLASCLPHYVSVSAFDRLGNESPPAIEAFGMPAGTGSPCSLGKLQAGGQPGCGHDLALTVADSNADTDLSSAGTVTVTVVSDTDPAGIAVLLTETAPASFLFSGGALISREAGPGALPAGTGDTLTVTYHDADDGTGSPRQVLAQVQAGDCDPPVISDLSVVSRASDRAVVEWFTDEPSTSRVRFGQDPSLEHTIDVATPVTHHAVLLTGLTPCTTVHYEVSSADVTGNLAERRGASGPLSFGTWRDIPLYAEDFESGAPGWQHASLSAAADEWELGLPQDGPGPPPSGSSAWGIDLDGPYENGADMVLVSPAVDLASKEAITLTFRHWYDIFSSGAPDGFDDGAFVEISDDDGATWHPVQPVGGYPDRIAGQPYLPFASGAYAGRSAGWVPASFVLDGWAGKVIRIRFHLLEDPLEISITRHPGWYLDDIEVSFSLSCHEGSLSWDRADYGCGGQPAHVRLMDVDIDTPGPDTAVVTLRSQGEPGGETIVLQESPGVGGVFEAEVPLSPVDAPGTLRVLDGDTILAVYDDADDGTGSPALVEASAHVGDCQAPALLNARVADRTPTSFRMLWETSEPADSRVLYGPDDGLGLEERRNGLTLQHDVTVAGLSPCTTYHATVASADALGNLARLDAASPPLRLALPFETSLLREGFDAGAPGWSHAGEGDTWTMLPSGLAATVASGTYARPALANAAFVLASPGFDLGEAPRPALLLRHAYDFATSFQGGDGGWVEGWNGRAWVTLTPDAGYTAWIDPEAARTGERLRGFGGSSVGFVWSRFDLTPLLHAGNRQARLRLRVFVEAGKGPVGTGWRIDEAAVVAELACHQGRPGFDPVPLTCAATQAGVILHEADLDRTPAPDTAQITLSSTGGGTDATVILTETGAMSGVFRGVATLDPDGSGTAPRSAQGDRLTLTYEDADDGTGVPSLRSSTLEVSSCAAPVLKGLSARQAGPSSAVIGWGTSAPSTSQVTLTPAPPGTGPTLEATRADLVTSHRIEVHGLTSCTPYHVTARSTSVEGITATDGLTAPLVVESVDRITLFSDDMEGPNPGWSTSGIVNEWQRGVPVDPPGTAFSGQRVWGTDLTGAYNGGTDATLTSPPIDLRNVSSARLTFWHWYDIFGTEPPNSLDDSAWLEVQLPGGQVVYVEPIGGYPDATDEQNGRPLGLGTPVYAGMSEDWEKAELDLTPFVGQVIRLRFRIWNDQIELIVNGRTGAGWTIDNVEVFAPRFCSPAPVVTSFSLPRLAQGASASTVLVAGNGFREGAVVSLGPGLTLTPISITPTRLTCSLSADARAPMGRRDLTVTLPDGQSASLSGALEVTFSPSRSDLNGSGRVDGSDLAALAAAFGSLEGQPRYRTEADLNGDGAVDGLDLALLATSFGILFE